MDETDAAYLIDFESIFFDIDAGNIISLDMLVHFKRDDDPFSEEDNPFFVKNLEKILDFDNFTERDFKTFVELLENSLLYKTNLLFMMDRALTSAASDKAVYDQITKVFRTVQFKSEPAADNMGRKFKGDLRHAALGHIKTQDLVESYSALLEMTDLPKTIEESLSLYHMFKPNAEDFLALYEGYLANGRGMVRLGQALKKASRKHHEDDKPLETYVEKGQLAAKALAFSTFEDVLEAWLASESRQRRMCALLDRILPLLNNKAKPLWVKIEIFTLLEREAMKQVYAETIVRYDAFKNFWKEAPEIFKSVKNNADGGVDPNIQQLLGQTLNLEAQYSGAAGNFVLEAARRYKEFYKTQQAH